MGAREEIFGTLDLVHRNQFSKRIAECEHSALHSSKHELAVPTSMLPAASRLFLITGFGIKGESILEH